MVPVEVFRSPLSPTNKSMGDFSLFSLATSNVYKRKLSSINKASSFNCETVPNSFPIVQIDSVSSLRNPFKETNFRRKKSMNRALSLNVHEINQKMPVNRKQSFNYTNPSSLLFNQNFPPISARLTKVELQRHKNFVSKEKLRKNKLSMIKRAQSINVPQLTVSEFHDENDLVSDQLISSETADVLHNIENGIHETKSEKTIEKCANLNLPSKSLLQPLQINQVKLPFQQKSCSNDSYQILNNENSKFDSFLKTNSDSIDFNDANKTSEKNCSKNENVSKNETEDEILDDKNDYVSAEVKFCGIKNVNTTSHNFNPIIPNISTTNTTTHIPTNITTNTTLNTITTLDVTTTIPSITILPNLTTTPYTTESLHSDMENNDEHTFLINRASSWNAGSSLKNFKSELSRKKINFFKFKNLKDFHNSLDILPKSDKIISNVSINKNEKLQKAKDNLEGDQSDNKENGGLQMHAAKKRILFKKYSNLQVVLMIIQI